MTSLVTLTGDSLTPKLVAEVARGGARAVYDDKAEARIEASARALAVLVAEGRPIYGLSTGVGALEIERAPATRERDRRLLLSHAAGVGAPMRTDRVRATMLARANTFAIGRSGVSLGTAQALLSLLDRGVTPMVPEGGSIGASDLAPLAHIALVLCGEGRATLEGEALDAKTALARAGLAPIELRGRDALAIVNGLAQSAGVAALAIVDSARVIALAEAAAAMALAATGGSREFLDPHSIDGKRHEGQRVAAERMRRFLDGAAPARADRLRADLSFRYAPQVTGAARSALMFTERVVTAELDAAVDNPMIAADGWSTNDSGATSGQEIAQALDFLATSLVSVAVIAAARIAALLDAARNGGLPPFLRTRAVPDSGLMMAEYTAASLVAELRARAMPACILSAPVCAGTEDHASMSALAARHAAWTVDTVETVVAIELLVAARALSFGAAPAGLVEIARAVERAAPADRDRSLADEIESVRRSAASFEP